MLSRYARQIELECMRAMDGEKRTGIRARKRKMEKKDLQATIYNDAPFLSTRNAMQAGHREVAESLFG